MSLSQWGLWQDELDPLDYGLLASAYLRRVKFESRVLAVEVVKAFGESMSGKGGERIPAEAMIGMMGGF